MEEGEDLTWLSHLFNGMITTVVDLLKHTSESMANTSLAKHSASGRMATVHGQPGVQDQAIWFLLGHTKARVALVIERTGLSQIYHLPTAKYDMKHRPVSDDSWAIYNGGDIKSGDTTMAIIDKSQWIRNISIYNEDIILQ